MTRPRWPLGGSAALVALSPNAIRLLAVLGVLLMGETFVLWRRWSRAAESRISAVTAARERAEALVTSAAMRRDSVRRVQIELEQAEDSFVLAPSAAQAASGAAAAIRDLAASASTQLGTVNVHADSVEHRGVRWVSVDGEASGSFDALMTLARGMESGEPFIVKRFAIAPVPGAYGGTMQMRAQFTLNAAARRAFDFER